jgi:hypothetical protein
MQPALDRVDAQAQHLAHLGPADEAGELADVRHILSRRGVAPGVDVEPIAFTPEFTEQASTFGAVDRVPKEAPERRVPGDARRGRAVPRAVPAADRARLRSRRTLRAALATGRAVDPRNMSRSQQRSCAGRGRPGPPGRAALQARPLEVSEERWHARAGVRTGRPHPRVWSPRCPRLAGDRRRGRPAAVPPRPEVRRPERHWQREEVRRIADQPDLLAEVRDAQSQRERRAERRAQRCKPELVGLRRGRPGLRRCEQRRHQERRRPRGALREARAPRALSGRGIHERDQDERSEEHACEVGELPRDPSGVSALQHVIVDDEDDERRHGCWVDQYVGEGPTCHRTTAVPTNRSVAGAMHELDAQRPSRSRWPRASSRRVLRARRPRSGSTPMLRRAARARCEPNAPPGTPPDRPRRRSPRA